MRRNMLVSMTIGLAAGAIVPTVGLAATLSATSCSQSAVVAALGGAADGDIVSVPSGACTWSGLIINRRVTLKGAGVDATRISCLGGGCAETVTGGVRITGFTFSSCDGCLELRGTGWRVDNNKFNNTSHSTGVRARGEVDRVQPSGLVDHNVFLYSNVHSFGTAAQRVEGDYQDALWAQDPGFGTEKGLYVEDNTFANGINSVDCNYAGQYVFRFNRVDNSYLEAHSVQGNNRACQRWEIYNNAFTNTTWVLAFLRGGSGFVFGNTNNNDNPIALNNVRDTESRETAGRCDGTSNWDQNTAGQIGYACRDQVGRSRDSVKWSTGAAYNQPLTPAYIWNNTTSYGGGRQIAIDLHFPSSPKHIVANRDYYEFNPTFNGSAGIGSGVLSSRPSTCTPGAGYWATDQGSWNTKGPSGVLYRCIASNTWAVGFVPYTYPHPISAGGGQAPISAPGNLRTL